MPLPDGLEAEIEHLTVAVANKTLGVWTCPTGDVTAHFCSMAEKGPTSID